MDDFQLIADDGTRLEIEAFVNDDFDVVAFADATYVVVIDEDGEHELLRIERPTHH